MKVKAVVPWVIAALACQAKGFDVDPTLQTCSDLKGNVSSSSAIITTARK